MRYRFIAFLGLGIICIDQMTKWLVTAYFTLQDEVIVTSFFSLVHVRNRGAAFGFLNDPSISWQFWLFGLATIIALVVVYYIAKSSESCDYVLYTALGCIVGGAIGNFIDRLRFREVIDFLDFHIGQIHWPAFNVADIAICIGAILTAYVSFKPSPDKEKPSE